MSSGAFTVEELADELASVAKRTMCVFVHRIDAHGLDCVGLSLFDISIHGLSASALNDPANAPTFCLMLRHSRGIPWNNERMYNLSHVMQKALSARMKRFIPSWGIQELSNAVDEQATNAGTNATNETEQLLLLLEDEEERKQDTTIAPAA
jgi:hypothetical protein